MFESVCLDVTAEDIWRGKPEDSESCPVALSLKRAVPMATNVDVGYDVCFHFDGRVYLAHDEDVEEFAASVDNGRPVEPCRFNLSFKDIGPARDDVSDDTLCTLPVERNT
jgi:hypothetical protein